MAPTRGPLIRGFDPAHSAIYTGTQGRDHIADLSAKRNQRDLTPFPRPQRWVPARMALCAGWKPRMMARGMRIC